ncbi:hypothetical protein ACFVH6_14425 [Spirillospora sp. NPDC127200]
MESLLAKQGNHAETAKPKGPGAWERRFAYADRMREKITTPWRPPSRCKRFAPAPFTAGDWGPPTPAPGRSSTRWQP